MLVLCMLLYRLHSSFLTTPSFPHTRWIYPVAGVSSAGFYLVDLHKLAVSEDADSELLLSVALTLIIQLIAVLGLCGWQISS